MIQVDRGQEQQEFISYIEKAIVKLSEGEYSDFLDMFDDSRISEEGLILALRFLDEERPVLKIDNPIEIKCGGQRIGILPFKDRSGYHIDYDLTTDGQLNDLTISFLFLKSGRSYVVSLEDLRTL